MLEAPRGPLWPPAPEAATACLPGQRRVGLWVGANTELFAGCWWPPAGLGGGSPTSRAGWSCREAPGTVASETSQLRDSAYGAHTLATTSGLLSAARARLRGCGGEFPGQRARALRSGRGQIEGQASEANADARTKASPPARPWPPAGSRAVPCPWIPSALIAAGQGSNSHFLARLSLPRGRTI